MVKDGGALARATSIGPRAATGLEVSADAAGGIPRYGITRRGGNNDRLSTLWREVISLAGVARSFSSGVDIPPIIRTGAIPPIIRIRAIRPITTPIPATLTTGGDPKHWQRAAPSSRRLREMEVAMEQMRMHAEMNKPAEPQPVNPRDVA